MSKSDLPIVDLSGDDEQVVEFSCDSFMAHVFSFCAGFGLAAIVIIAGMAGLYYAGAFK